MYAPVWLTQSRSARAAVIVWAVCGVAPFTAAAELQPSWQNRGQLEIAGSALAVDVAGDVVVAGGNVCTAFVISSCNWFVRAIDATSGATMWEERLNVGAFDRSLSVVIHGNRVFASGHVGSQLGIDFAVRAYDLHTGMSLWQQRLDAFGEVAYVVGARGNLLFAAGR
jgi:outer membrane protein assembly factor BamB